MHCGDHADHGLPNGSRVIAVFLFSMLAACAMEEQRAQAEMAVRQFHQRISVNDFSKIYTDADEEFRRDVREKEFVTMLRNVSTQLGGMRSTRQAYYAHGIFRDRGHVATTGYVTVFENGGAEEEFIWRFSAGAPKLVNYDITSAQMRR